MIRPTAAWTTPSRGGRDPRFNRSRHDGRAAAHHRRRRPDSGWDDVAKHETGHQRTAVRREGPRSGPGVGRGARDRGAGVSETMRRRTGGKADGRTEKTEL